MEHMHDYWNSKEIGLVLVHYWVLGAGSDSETRRPRGFRFPSRTEWMEGTGRDGNG